MAYLESGIILEAQLTYMGLHSLQHRGQEGAGIVVSDDQTLKGERGLLLTEAIKDTNMENLKGYPHAIGQRTICNIW